MILRLKYTRPHSAPDPAGGAYSEIEGWGKEGKGRQGLFMLFRNYLVVV